MAVVSDDGAAGIIVGCSQNFSVAMSLLNVDFRLSARIRSNGYFGSLAWDGANYRFAVLVKYHSMLHSGLEIRLKQQDTRQFFLKVS